ncbi:CG11454 [Drosophila busckii]|uniref:CG11454 n=1 Tax=Drosophila busckii TaxID=30019 RepID=A0A0M4EB57_DROBS|nr:RNA-binding protein 7 [Drosophila busckii]ALC39764.1 CG11454 [Drosophila busckii]
MDQIAIAIQQAAIQQEMYNANAALMSPQMPMMMQMHHPPSHHMNFSMRYSLQQNGEEDYDDDDDEDDEQQRTIYCNNLDERVTEDILYEVFLQAGPIESVRIPLDNMGRQRNFGFVSYQHKCAVPFALQLFQGLELYEKKINMRSQGVDRQRDSRMQQNPFDAPQQNYHPRYSHHEAMGLGSNYNNHNDLRRRSDSAVLDNKRPRPHQHQMHHQQYNYQQHNNSNRRSDQRYNHGKRRL